MQQIQQSLKIKKTTNLAVFLSVNNSWWSLRDVKITFGDDPEHDTKEIRELLDEEGDNAEPII